MGLKATAGGNSQTSVEILPPLRVGCRKAPMSKTRTQACCAAD